MRPVLPARTFNVSLDLGLVEAELAEIATELGDHLDGYAPQLQHAGHHVWLRITVPALDLWLALLMAMAAVTATGYPVHQVGAQPADALTEAG